MGTNCSGTPAGKGENYVYESLDIHLGRMSGNVSLLYARRLPYSSRKMTSPSGVHTSIHWMPGYTGIVGEIKYESG